ncbi:MAG: hydroxymethylglutaryl-CoA reductase [Gammaproteobacteria bacterium]
MSTNVDRALRYIMELLQRGSGQELVERLAPRRGPTAPRFPHGKSITPDMLAKRWALLDAQAAGARAELLDTADSARAAAYEANIENFVGTVKVPVGVAGPLRVNGLFAQGDYYVPLATTEAALVASYNRGALLISAAGGCAAALLDEGVARAPGFAFDSLAEAGAFLGWIAEHLDTLKQVGEATTRHGRFKDLHIDLEGNHVYLIFDFTTGDAAGQNMVTIATDAIVAYIVAHCPTIPRYHFVEANHSGDKKASAQSYQRVRGKKVSAEVQLPRRLVEKLLHTTPAKMVDYWRMSAMGGVLSGTLGVQGHYANGLAALYIACGQDAACVSESAVGVTRMELAEDDGLYVAVTLPNLVVGTVGGGTALPSQRACLEILGLAGAGHARAFAELAAALCLAGELSIIGALCAGHFTRAHQSLARRPGRTS